MDVAGFWWVLPRNRLGQLSKSGRSSRLQTQCYRFHLNFKGGIGILHVYRKNPHIRVIDIVYIVRLRISHSGS